MKFLIVVLALSGLCAAVPEADPEALTVLSPYNAYFNHPLTYNTLPLYSNLHHPLNLPYAAPIATPVVTAPVAYAAPVRPLTSRDCVTPGGCAVKTLLEHGIAKREAEAEPEADPAFIAPALPYAAGFASPYLYNALPYTHAFPYALNHPFTPYAFNYPVQAPLVKAVETPIVKAVETPIVKAVQAPVVHAPIIKTVETPVVHTPLVKTVVNPVVTYVRPAQPVKVVEQKTKPVTYTHLGAHPINPTTVLETETNVHHALI